MFTTYLYEPLFNALFFLYHIIPLQELGLSIIILTVVIKLILFIPSTASLKSQKALQEMQPKIKAVREKYKNKQEEMARELMKLYKENKVNPLSSCLPLLIQLPILWALYRVFIGGLHTDPSTGILVAEQLDHLYPSLREIFSQTAINTHFLGVDLAKSGNYIFALLAGGLQFVQSKMLSTKKPAVETQGAKDENAAALVNKQMLYILPAFTFFFGLQFPAGLSLYWIVFSLFTILQQLYFLRKKKSAEETPPATPPTEAPKQPSA